MSANLQFDSGNPFPYFEVDTYSYADSKLHAERADAWLGLNVESVEAAILANKAYDRELVEKPILPEYWRGLPPEALQTPYLEFRTILELIQPKPGQTVVDLGAGYGRLGHVIGRYYPTVNFVGYEYVSERVRAGGEALKKAGYLNATLVEADLFDSTFAPIAAEFYFLYDYGSRKAIEKTLSDLMIISTQKPITVVARGRASRDIIQRRAPWLSQVWPVRHFRQYSIYSSGPSSV